MALHDHLTKRRYEATLRIEADRSPRETRAEHALNHMVDLLHYCYRHSISTRDVTTRAKEVFEIERTVGEKTSDTPTGDVAIIPVPIKTDLHREGR